MKFPEIMPDNLASTQGLSGKVCFGPKYTVSLTYRRLLSILGTQNCNKLANSENSKETHAGSLTKTVVKDQ